MGQSLLELAFGVDTLNDQRVVEKFGSLGTDGYAQGLFRQYGVDWSPEKGRAVPFRSVKFSRAPAPFGDGRSPATAVESVDQDRLTAYMVDISISSQPIPLDALETERDAQLVLSTEGRNLNKRRQIAKEVLAWMALTGSVDSSQVPGSKVAFGYTQGVRELKSAASWATAGTKIVSSELDALHQDMHDSSGLEPRRMIVDRLVKGYLLNNNEVQLVTTGGEGKSDAFARTTRILGNAFQPMDFNGYWWDVTGAKYDKNGVLTKYLGDKKLIALPGDDELASVLAYAEGTTVIPDQAIGAADSNVGLRVRGDYAYAYQTPNPGAIVLVFGWKGIFFLTFPEAVGVNADVTQTG